MGISAYLGDFIAAGFLTWDNLLDITEAELESLGVKRGHRRESKLSVPTKINLLMPATEASTKNSNRERISQGSSPPPLLLTTVWLWLPIPGSGCRSSIKQTRLSCLKAWEDINACTNFEMLEVKVPIIFLGTAGFLLRMDGRQRYIGGVGGQRVE
ncbi:hypothetical protein V498_04775 [Pseudogymnoascus sp. VKM F-4517 (FW-2822)]|nr:hypothetical protein V498_04775 [Pseudogymnoascus sp. VKM F-4517 (FW-2822)]